jgi:hypothetical protein
MALFTVLLIAVSPRTFYGWKEGFQTAGLSTTEVKLVGQKNKWWVERLMEENPIGIEEEKVNTNAIQDNTNSSNSFSSSR